MTVQVSRLRSAGIAKEVSLGTIIATPTRYLNIIPPDGFTPMIDPLTSKGIEALRDMVLKIQPGPASLKGMKVKLELEPENCGEIFQALFGADTPTETASFVVTTGVNDKIDFKENGGSQLHATLSAGTYIAGTTSATDLTLCEEIKDALEAAAGATLTYTVTYSDSTKKFTIAASSTTVQILWLTGTNTATSAKTLLGFTNTDTANAGSVTSDSTTQTPAFSHQFVAQQVSVLPTLSWWFDKNPIFPLFGGCMANKADIACKAGGIVEFDTEWEGIAYDGTTGSAKSTSYSAIVPFVFQNVVVNVDGSPVTGYDNLKISIDNGVKADHTLTNSQYPQKIYTQHLDVQISAELFFEDLTQYNKFIAGTTAHFNVVITSGSLVPGGLVPYSLTLDLPLVYYKSAPLHIPANGPLKIPFVGHAKYNFSGSPANTILATLVNGVATQY